MPPSHSPTQRQWAVAACQVTPVTGWCAGPWGTARPVTAAKGVHRPIVTGVRAIRWDRA